VQDEEWLLEQSSASEPLLFDYVHARFLVTAFDDPLQVMRNAYRHMRPGGWIEYLDPCIIMSSPDGSHEGTTWTTVVNLSLQGGALRNRDFLVPARYKELLIEAGFVDVHEYRFQVPFGTWPADPKLREVGRYLAADAVGWTRTSAKLLRLAGVSEEILPNLPEMVYRELRNREIKHFAPKYVAFHFPSVLRCKG
jgi:SAM-dependent methyltransferase